MGVVPFYRRKGIASALLTEMLAADERGYGAVTLELPADDGQASRLLEGHRFASHWGEVSGTVVWRRNVSDRNRDINTKPSASTEVVHLETHHER
jgi:GNAT superfamily N-acetyltransferase